MKQLVLAVVVLGASAMFAQGTPIDLNAPQQQTLPHQDTSPQLKPTRPANGELSQEITLPAGTKIPLALKHAITTKSAHEGDAVYAETTFPVVVSDHIVIPAGCYVQGTISNVKRAGRVKGRAEVLVHFNTLIFTNGYTVLLPGAIDNVPGIETGKMKDKEGTIQGDSSKGKDAATIAQAAGMGGLIGAAADGGKGAGIGGAAGGVIGLATVLLTRGPDVRLEAGSTMETVLERPIVVDMSRAHTTQ